MSLAKGSWKFGQPRFIDDGEDALYVEFPDRTVKYVPERTCRNIHPDVFQCSECYAIDDDWKNPPYCHGCGAKVIE